MTTPLTTLEQLCYSTTRIECETPDGKKATGTGFFFNFLLNSEQGIPVVITNKHVVEGMSKGRFKMTQSDANGNPINQQQFNVDISSDFEKKWTFHPDPNIDLCAMPIGQLIAVANVLKAKLFFKTIDKTIFPTAEQLHHLDVIEDIIMVGYPNGIWDKHNNMPIIRKGTTATHPNLDYNGKSEFVIDAACFPGSSGSPVLIHNKGGYSTRNGFVMSGQRILFLGILYAGPQHTATGELHVVDVPTAQKHVTFSRIPNNLGIVIKADKILDFEPIFRKKYNV